MIKINLHSKFGNQLFQMAYAFIVAKESKQNIIMRPNSSVGYCLQMINPPVIFNFLPEKYMLIMNKIFFKLLKHEDIITEYSCLKKNYFPKKTNNLLIEGYFQDGVFFTPYEAELKKIFSIRRKFKNQFNFKYGHYLRDNILLVHLRLTDYKTVYFDEIKASPLLTLNWYMEVLKLIDVHSFKNLIVISDDIAEAKEILKKLPYDFIYINDVMENDFQFLLHADCLIIPNSSFAWWGAFLNNKPNKIVYAPKNWAGYNADTEYPAGIMIDKFKWV